MLTWAGWKTVWRDQKRAHLSQAPDEKAICLKWRRSGCGLNGIIVGAASSLFIILAAIVVYVVVHKPAKSTSINISNGYSASGGSSQATGSGSIIETKVGSEGTKYLANSSGQALYTYVIKVMAERLSFASRVIGVLKR